MQEESWWDVPDPARKLFFLFLPNDFLLQNTFSLPKTVVWREMSGGSWNSTKPRIKQVSCKVSLGLETALPFPSPPPPSL